MQQGLQAPIQLKALLKVELRLSPSTLKQSRQSPVQIGQRVVRINVDG